MEWQPIDTAPKDGTKVLISDGRYVIDAYWDDNASLEQCERGPAWQVFNCDGDCWYSVAVTDPTHWMPLPEPPNKEIGMTQQIIIPFKLPTWNQLLAMNKFERAKVTKWIKEYVSTSIANEKDLQTRMDAVLRLSLTPLQKLEYGQMIVPNTSKKYRIRKKSLRLKKQ